MNGVICVRKEQKWTSNDVVAKMRGILHEKHVGHAGTLDPDAEGVLPVTVGKATKLFDYLTTCKKIYRAKIKFGTVTDTQDLSGKVLSKCAVNVKDEDVLLVLPEFTGRIMQVPPQYSAIKRNGVRLCDMARKGQEVKIDAREIEVKSIKMTSPIKNDECILEIECGKGTYIRTLCHDIGAKLGCGACMAHLERVSAGGLDIEHSLTLEEIQAHVDKNDFSFIIPVDEAISFYPKVCIDVSQKKKLENGNQIDKKYADKIHEGLFRIYCDNKFFGIAKEENGLIKTVCMLGE